MTKTQARIVELWAKAPASRAKHRLAELRKLVHRDLRRTARTALLAETARKGAAG